MARKLLMRFPIILGLILAIGMLAVACEGGKEEEATPTPSPTGVATAAPEETPAPQPGDAGIPSNPRDARGLEGLFELDDGLAMFAERPADEDRTGVTEDTIKLGRTTGITGVFAPYEPFWGGILDAMIKRINEAGGIHGRKIELITRDDASDPTTAVQVTKELVEGDQIFSMFFAIGAPSHSAVHEYHVEQRVPWLFYFDGSTLGQEPVTSPWDFNGQNVDILSGFAMGQAVAQMAPDAKVAVVWADFPASQDGHTGILTALEQAGLEVVADISHDLTQVDLTPQAQQVGDSGADWLIYHGSITQSASLIRALRQTVGSNIPVIQWGWVPTGDPETDQIFDGTYQVTFMATEMTHPDREAWAKLKALADEEGVPYSPLLSAQSLMVLQHLVRALEMAGPDLTREGLIEALNYGFTGDWQCDACLAPTIFGPQDHWMNETFLLEKWNQAEQKMEILDELRYETSEGKGVRGNFPDFPCQPPSAEFPQGTCPWKEE